MFNLARKLEAEIKRHFRISCRCGQVGEIIPEAADSAFGAAKTFVEQGWRWIEANGGAMCPECAEKEGLL